VTNHLSREVFLGEVITSTPSARERLRAAVSTASSVALLGGVGALFDSKTIALAGAAIGSAITNGVFTTGFMCGFFESKENQTRINAALLPKSVGLAAGGGLASLLGGVALSAAAKKHPVAGAVIGASLAGALVAAVCFSKECPK
jgi:hypothetical protein